MSVETNAKIHWIAACAPDDIDEEDVMRFDHDGASYAVYRIADGYYASEGWCTHEKAHLADGFVVNREIECPLHQGRFDIPSGKAKSAPVCVHLKTYPVRVENGEVLLGLPVQDAS
ncbi:Rieske 2Fe-2S domain-containing protein [Paraburkholderia sp. Tr-20389]|uniref:MocE family 2Fe-2S type ferredoxin n=1 Tax=Paraburkholderia sp. Tr-20389 TaxID=2703903 RepID=UPI001980E6F4|nr:MocE family 2Fe-2S type ferredoxin [Paraburkholderia sp. Tr-20389]MBN3755667.1 Rieske 2Fe-2S domain-containing protein [Paraburkholderia sp. Tr-20389]